MGYACPVCGDPQADAEHLANHLAFTAMLRGADHEAWLDERVDGWADLAPEALADRISEHADEREFPQVFEDTTGGHDHDHAHGDRGGQSGSPRDPIADAAPGGVADLDDFEGEQEDVLAEARELTRQRRTNAGDGDGEAGERDGDATDGDDGVDGGPADGDGATGDGEETGSS